MLTERCEVLRKQIKGFAQLREAKKNADYYRQRLQEIAAMQRSLEAILPVWRTLRRNGIAVPLPPDVVALTSASLAPIASAYADDRASIIQSQAFGKRPNDLEGRLKKLCAALDEGCRSAWESYTRGFAASGDEGVLDVLGRIAAFAQAAGRLREIRGRLARRIASLPQNDEEFQAFHADVEKLRQAWDSLTGSRDVPGEVLAFLREVGQVGAELALLTEAVREWLAARGAEGYFRVVSR